MNRLPTTQRDRARRRRVWSPRLSVSWSRLLGRTLLFRAGLCCLLPGLGVRPVQAGDPPSQVITPPLQVSDAFKQFAAFFEILGKSYVDPGRLKPNEHTTAALRAYLRNLDPEAALLPPPRKMVTLNTDNGPVMDIGVSLTTRGRFPTVITPHPDSPAQAAGLMWGDQIRAIDGDSMENADLAACMLKLWGPANSTVELTVFDPALGTTRTVVMTRRLPEKVAHPPVMFLAGGIAYRRLDGFTVETIEALRDDLDRLVKEQARGLILDLRNNPGGMFEAVPVAADLFLAARLAVVTVDYPDPQQKMRLATNTPPRFARPVVLLVNGGTCAEAEIFAAALRDNDRARLVGTVTFGKGRKIDQFPLPDGALLFIPMARYLTPSNQEFHGIGLAPDVMVEMPRADERRLATRGFGQFDWLQDKQQILATDKPLAKALDLLLESK